MVVDLPAIWRHAGRDRPGRVLDMSVHGLLVTVEQWIELNHVLDLRVSLPDRSVSFLVTSRFVREHQVGVSILAATPEDLNWWASHYRCCVRDRRLLVMDHDGELQPPTYPPDPL